MFHIKHDCKFWGKQPVITLIKDFLGCNKIEAEALFEEHHLETVIDPSLNPKGRKREKTKWLTYI